LDLREVARIRLRNQRVSGAKFKSAEEVVRWLGCVQSQEYPLAKWTLGLRAAGLHDADLDAALYDGRILRTHIMRPTWHFVLPEDLRWIMQLTGPRVARVIRSVGEIVVPEERVIQRALDAIREALAGRRRMTRAEITTMLTERGLATDYNMAIPVFMRAELDLVICSGGLVGKNQTYALVDERAPIGSGSGPAVFDRDWSLGELVRRYFTSHGPATVADFVWWSGLTVADTRRGLAVNGDGLRKLTIDGADFWWAGDVGGSAAGAAERSPTVHLMQGYDEYIVAYRSPRDPINVDRLIPPAFLSRPPYLHAVVLDTQGVGFWRRVALPKNGGFGVEVKLVRDLSAAEHNALDAAVSRYSEFVAQPVTLMA
jgi:hypothetical protein